jgi:hypothetical protein
MPRRSDSRWPPGAALILCLIGGAAVWLWLLS